MELSELVLIVLRQANLAVGDFTRGATRTVANDLAYIANKITTELPKIKLPPAESSESPGPADDTKRGP